VLRQHQLCLSFDQLFLHSKKSASQSKGAELVALGQARPTCTQHQAFFPADQPFLKLA